MNQISKVLITVAFFAYIIFGTAAVSYVKREIFGWETVFTTNIVKYYMFQIVLGIIFGWLAIPVALIHHVVTNRD